MLVLAHAHRVLLKVYRWFPRGVRRRLVRALAPSFTVGAICQIERADGARLLVRQAYRNGWGLPGGLIKRGEEAADCVRREVFEEVGLRVEVTSAPAVVVDPAPQRVDVVYRARPLSLEEAEAARPSSPEIDEVGWFPADQLPVLQHETVSALVALARLDGEATSLPTAAEAEPLNSGAESRAGDAV